MTKKVLIVDDSNDFIFLMNSLFKFHKIEIDCLSDPLKVILKLEDSYDLIVLDYEMPELNGIELSQKIRKRYKNRVPIVILTATTFDQNQLHTLRQLDVEYLKKPILPKVLINYVLNKFQK